MTVLHLCVHLPIRGHTEPDCIRFKTHLEKDEILASEQIIHRELKLSNILVHSKYKSKIADFGLAIIKSKGTVARTQCGTKYWLCILLRILECKMDMALFKGSKFFE